MTAPNFASFLEAVIKQIHHSLWGVVLLEVRSKRQGATGPHKSKPSTQTCNHMTAGGSWNVESERSLNAKFRTTCASFSFSFGRLLGQTLNGNRKASEQGPDRVQNLYSFTPFHLKKFARKQLFEYPSQFILFCEEDHARPFCSPNPSHPQDSPEPGRSCGLQMDTVQFPSC